VSVHVVTSTGYEDSDRSVDAAFSSKELAEAYIARTWKGRERFYNVRIDVLEVDKQ
jgi:hypothetical protein